MNAAIKLKAALESFEYELPVRFQLRLIKTIVDFRSLEWQPLILLWQASKVCHQGTVCSRLAFEV